MSGLFDQWKEYRDEKNDIMDDLGTVYFDDKPSRYERRYEADQLTRYNWLYAQMYQIQKQFTAEDWAAYEADQAEFQQAERQAWLIKERYGSAKPSQGIADWWIH